MEAEGRIELIIRNPSAGGTDGRIASQSTQEYPLNVIVDTRIANHTIVKIALRCTEGFRTTGSTVVSFTGATAGMWEIAKDDSFIDEEAAEEAHYLESIILDDVIDDTNQIFWIKVSTDGTESAMVDTSVKVHVYGRTVPNS